MMVVKLVDHDGRKRRSNNFRTWQQQHCMIAWTYSFLHLTSVVMWPRTCQLVISSSDTNGWQNWSISHLVVNRRQEEPDFTMYFLPFPTFLLLQKIAKLLLIILCWSKKGEKYQTWSTFPAVCPRPPFGKSWFVQNRATLAVLSITEVLIYTTSGVKKV